MGMGGPERSPVPLRSRTKRSGSRGAPKGNDNARRHGFYAAARKDTPKSFGGAAHAPASPPGEGAGKPSPAPILSLEQIIAELYAKQKDLAAHIETLNYSDASIGLDLADRKLAALALFRQNAATLGRLVRDSHDLRTGEGDRLAHALNAALDAMSKELGIKL